MKKNMFKFCLYSLRLAFDIFMLLFAGIFCLAGTYQLLSISWFFIPICLVFGGFMYVTTYNVLDDIRIYTDKLIDQL